MLNLIKIGGNIIDNESHLAQFLREFSAIHGHKILVHGGGKLATQLGTQLGISSQMIEGKRVTDADTLRVVTMVYAGWLNKHIVAQLQGIGCNAVGLSGADANLIPATQRAPEPINYGYVGDIMPARINTEFLNHLLEQDMSPVFCAITHNSKGQLLNSNADSIASSLAIAMSKIEQVRLIYCFEKNGVLSNVDNEGSIIPELTYESYEEYKTNGIISQGMIPKLDNAFKAISAGVSEVVIKHALHLNSGGGTVIHL
ncbi:acetylglutamate kinase [Bacteroidia bacterium]|nr:acetylglutamate kinase [Bacteroidia bacterium]